MSSTHENRRRVQRAYDALADGDPGGFLAALAADVRWSEALGLRLTGGEHHGRDAVADRVLGPFVATVPDLTVTAEVLVADGSRVVVLGRYGGTAAPTGLEVDVAFVHVWELSGVTAAAFTQHTDTALLNAAFGPMD